jgi:hypothetical protein
MKMKAKWLLAIAAPAALALGIVTAAPGAAAIRSTVSSPNWAGYEAANTSGSFQYVQATFTVPSLNCTRTPTASVAQLVALSGNSIGILQFNNAGEVRESCQNGTPAYEADWDSGCNGHGGTLPLTISPGDAVELSINGAALITAANLTTGAIARSDFSTTCGPNLGAEVFTSTNGSGAVADFAQVGFHQIQVEASGQSTPKPLVSPGWSVNRYILRGPSGRADVKPEALLSGKFTSSFVNDWYFPS